MSTSGPFTQLQAYVALPSLRNFDVRDTSSMTVLIFLDVGFSRRWRSWSYGMDDAYRTILILVVASTLRFPLLSTYNVTYIQH